MLNYLKQNSSRIIIVLLLLSYFIPNLESIDRIGNQWLYLSIINLVGTIIIYFKHDAHFKFFQLKKNHILKWYFLFFITGIISLLSSSNLSESIITLNQYFNSFFAFYLMVYFLNDISHPEKFIVRILSFLFLAEIYFSFSPILNDISSGTLKFRSMSYSGLAANINITSFSLVFKIPILLYLIVNTKKLYQKISLSFLLLTSLYTIYILGSRGALLGLLISFGAYIIYLMIYAKNFKDNLKSLYFVFTPVLISIIFNLIFSSSDNSTSVIDRASTISISTNDGSVNQRLRYYKQGLDQFLESPFLGVGIGNWKLKSISYDKNDIYGYTVPYHAHNDFIQILVEQGILAFIFYVFVFISFVFIIFKEKLIIKNDLYIFILASFLVFFLDSNLNFPIARPISQIQFIFLLALVSINQKIENEK